jgi:hypothetical protein
MFEAAQDLAKSFRYGHDELYDRRKDLATFSEECGIVFE